MAEAGSQNDAAAALDFDYWRSIGDPEADGLVERLIALSEDTPPVQVARLQAYRLQELLDQLFAWTPAATAPLEPAEVESFLRKTDVLPPWFDGSRDLPRIARAQDLFDRFKMTARLVLGCASLPHCYAHGEIANTLTVSGMLGMRVRQRILETDDFVSAVMQPGSFASGAALPWIRKVRLIHALMRHLTMLRPDAFPDRTGSSLTDILLQRNWDLRDGMPLDQLELSYVLLTFSAVVVNGWQKLRLRPDREEQRDYLYAWALVGSLLGVQDPLLAPLRRGSLGEAKVFFAKLKDVERGTDLGKDPMAKEKGRLLTATLSVLLSAAVLDARLPPLLRAFRPAADPVLRILPRSLIRRLVERPTADELWVDCPPLLHWLLHEVIIEFVGFTDFIATAAGRKIRESGMWADVSDQFRTEIRQRLRRAQAGARP
jgi:hypothetical protein